MPLRLLTISSEKSLKTLKWIYVFTHLSLSARCSRTAMDRTVAFDSSPADLAVYQHTQDLLNNFREVHRRLLQPRASRIEGHALAQ